MHTQTPDTQIDWAAQMTADHQRAFDIAKQRSALEAARHELTTLHGLIAADGAAPHETWSIDTSSVVSLIDEALANVTPQIHAVDDLSTQILGFAERLAPFQGEAALSNAGTEALLLALCRRVGPLGYARLLADLTPSSKA